MKKEKLTEVIKLRVTSEQKKSIEQTAQKTGMSTSDIIRKAIFNSTAITPYAIKIQKNLIKNQLYNTISLMDIPQKYKTNILEEVKHCD
ncbi:ribbon-helix-helix domain-containing protein [Blautia producta]|uniref:ribbon-helix-helix domain-containing protein n=1 Tax=Blautia TaxID=572511 RepID=UPI0025839319|nr:ribbon-helix-helix domain-containing protein [Blautia sp.]